MRAFREAVESVFAGEGGWEQAAALLADDVVFTSPVAFKPYHGKAITAAILHGVSRVFRDFGYVREIDDHPHSALVFRAEVGDTGIAVEGCDFLTVNADGLISELTVMVRPLKAAQALADAMGAQFEQIQREAMAAMQQGAQQ